MATHVQIFLQVDGLGWQQSGQRGFLRDVLPHRQKLETLLGYSTAIYPTILTGVPPREHGHYAHFLKAEGQSRLSRLAFLANLPERIGAHPQFRRVLSCVSRWGLGLHSSFQLNNVPFDRLPYLEFDAAMEQNRKGDLLDGRQTIFDAWEQSGRPWMRSSPKQGDADRLQNLIEVLIEEKTELCYVFLKELDTLMHQRGLDSVEVDKTISRLQSDVRRVLKIASKHYEQVHLNFFSGHGMAQVTKLVDLLPRFEELPFRYGEDYVAVWDTTLVRFWFLHEHARRDIMAWLDVQPEGEIIRQHDLQRWGCDFPDQRFGELFYLLPPGSLFIPNYVSGNYVRGMHGYHPDAAESPGCWLSNQPGVLPRRITDVFTAMKAAATKDNPQPEAGAQKPSTAMK